MRHGVACTTSIAATLAVTLSTAAIAAPRPHEGERAIAWPETMPAGEVEVDPPASESSAAPTTAPAQAPVPPPRPVPSGKRITVAVGLGPEAPGNAAERDLLDRLERSTRVSPDPPTTVRRLRPGTGDARSICRDRLDDVVILVGYIPDRTEPVVVPYDCRLDYPLGIRAIAAVDEDGLVGALWAEHESLRASGMQERRGVRRLSNRARIGIAAGVTIVVLGVAVGLLVANALRDEEVVIKVSP
jgi:hypothetical protein